MANTTVQASGILSKLAELFFKGVDKLLDSAIEYQNDNGILRGTTVIPVKDSKDNDTEFVITLSPVEGQGNIREGTFIVNFSCKDLDDLDTVVDNVDYQDAAIVIDKQTQSKFEEVVNKIIKQNGLSRMQPKDESAEEEDSSSHSQTHRINTKNKQGADVVVTVRITQINKRNRYDIEIEADVNVDKKFTPKTVTSSEKVADTIYQWLEDNDLLEHIDDDDDEWIQSIRTWDSSEGVESSRKINMTLRKSITANEEVIDLVKIYASYNIDEAMAAVDSVLDDDKFLRSLQEGDTDLIVIDEGEDLDVEETDESTDPIDVAMMLLSISDELKRGLFMLDISRTSFEPISFDAVLTQRWCVEDFMVALGRFVAKRTDSIPAISQDVCILPSLNLTPQSPVIDKLQFSHQLLSSYLSVIENYMVNIDDACAIVAADNLLVSLNQTVIQLQNAIECGDYGSQIIGQPLVIQEELGSS